MINREGKCLFSSESVTEGHPDKLCDQVSDAVLDAILTEDPTGRVACECLATTGMVVVAGEITTKTWVDIPDIARSTIKNIGYTNPDYGLDYKSCAILSAIDRQSLDISQGVSEGDGLFEEQGAGDQGLMFGYATNETDEMMPLPITLAHHLTMQLAKVRKAGGIDWLRPDGKSQVTIEYQDGKAIRAEAIVISTQHHPEPTYDEIRHSVVEKIIRPVIPENLWDDETKVFVNPTGRFVVGGPHGDSGVTGRKIIVDTYGGWESHGGGAFSGKDPSKVDRSASYFARYVAKNVVASGLADECSVQVAYAIGVARPVGVRIQTFGTEKVPVARIEQLVKKHFDFRPKAIIDKLQLLRPIYTKTASYGHFGRSEPEFTWEATDMAELLKA
jgi:S-adenosylmethionine synthetase